jgi:DNA-binding HxlR family transcriptional regulator
MPKVSNSCVIDDAIDFCMCPLTGIIETISKKWTLLIIGLIGNHGKLRYNEILGKLDGISPKTLADRLKELTKEGILQREFFSEIPPRVEYRLTDDGIALRNAMIPLMQWLASRKTMSLK